MSESEPTATVHHARDGGGSFGARPSRSVDQLFLVLEGARPLAGGARFSLEGVDEVAIRRGSSRSFAREQTGGRTILTLKVPDSLLSSSHGRLVKNAGAWSLVDDSSTNGTFIDGVRIQAKGLTDGACFEMGAAHFTLRMGMPTPEGAPADVESSNLGGSAQGNASLVPAYTEQLGAFTRIALSGLSILLLGESGSGKEVLASAAHALSGRRGPFVPVNCGALTATLMESQLFGHTKGSFSGALRDEPGFVRASDGGTLFLDEIGDLPGPSQAALLRVLETREVVPVGSTRAVPVDLRVVSATLKSAGALRPDLHARLAGFTHTLLPLRERMEDFGLVLAVLVQRNAGDRAASLKLSPEAGRMLLEHDWPLNVRELNHALGVALTLAQGNTLEVKDFPASIRGAANNTGRPSKPDDAASGAVAVAAAVAAPASAAPAGPLPPIPEDDASLRALVLTMLDTHGGNISDISRALGKTRMQIHRWMKRFDIDPTTFRK